MATLTTPVRAIGYRRRGKGRNADKWRMRSRDKYHLMKGDGDVTGEGMTVCGLIVWGEDMFVREDGFDDKRGRDYKRSDAYDVAEIANLPAERLCKRCLGPLHAED